MNVYEAITARRTIRDFDKKPVAREALERMLSAGLQAPSHNHLREWRFILVEDRAQRKALVSFFCKDWTSEALEQWLDDAGLALDSQRNMYRDAVPKQASMVLDAGALVIPCFREIASLLEAKTSLHQLNAFASMWAAIENILVAGTSENVHGVTKIVSSPEERDHIRAVLGIPDDFEIPCYLSLGYPREDAVQHEQVPVDLETSLCIDRWS